ncbi:MAG TPA: excinuclease ABC subunit UvrC [Syntrophorhabdaceae bacterium]|nr:excinuclease ABC subunit UvrC [Syntrophorhabdaceae bacterium]
MITEEIIGNLPESSGVYRFRDSDDNIIYIGKAKNLRDRVRSYFREGKSDVKTEQLVRHIDHIDFILTGSEKEAFLLENNFIKEHTPKYNVNLKDNKTYISLKLTVKDRFPALLITRKIVPDGSLYFGPYPHAREVRDVLKFVEDLYPIRKCKDTVFRKRKRPCMLFELGRCPGPCAGSVDETRYKETVEELKDFLLGKNEKVLKDIEQRISRAIGSWQFETAQVLKENYQAIKGMIEKQYVHEHFGKNRDVWAFSEDEKKILVVLLSFRRGILLSRRRFKEPLFTGTAEEVLTTFLFQYYDSHPIPDEIVLSEDIEDSELLESHLQDSKQQKVRIYGPGNRTVRDVIRLAIENLHETEQPSIDEAFRRSLHLRSNPVRIEVYDISHVHGKNPTGAMVVFEKFKASKKDYRVFHIRGESTMDDVAMLDEVLRRRTENNELGPLPDLFIIDGGKGQLSAAARVLREHAIDKDVISIAKGERRKRMEDLIYLPLRKNPLPLSKASPVFKEIVKMRDEAHRFAVASHHRWKRKQDFNQGPKKK